MSRSLSRALMAAALAAPAAPAMAAPAVIASIPPVHALVAGVMEGVAEPRLLVEGGQSPHTYSLAPSEAAALEEADLVVWVGPVLESFLERPVASIAREEAVLRLIRLDGLDVLANREGGTWEGHAHEHGHDEAHGDDHAAEDGHDEAEGHGDEAHGEAGGGHGDDHAAEGGHDEHSAAEGGHDAHAMDERRIDPHVWLDPDNARAIVAALAERLAALDPANAEAYRANAEALDARITETDAAIAERLAPVADVPYIVFHDAYHYFERRYDLAAVGSVTISPDRRPGARRLSEIREKIEDLGAACVFREPQFAPDLVETVVEDTDADVGSLDPLGAGLEPGPDLYPRLMTALADNLVDCLGPES
ncbi:MAG: zinc ABC transporter substrate-binding protein [Paracoccaceae bacterium]